MKTATIFALAFVAFAVTYFSAVGFYHEFLEPTCYEKFVNPLTGN